jgi:hypothetical protein
VAGASCKETGQLGNPGFVSRDREGRSGKGEAR